MMPTSEEPKVMVNETTGSDEQKALYQAARKVLLFYIGVFALAVEEIEALVDLLIERGEIFEQDGRKLLREVMEKRREEARKVEKRVSKPAKKVKNRMLLPSKGEIDALNEKIARLSEQIDELNKTQAEDRSQSR